jgi:Flp pilus assembly protein TadG
MDRMRFSGLRRLVADREGNVIVEFALALPILFLLIVGLLDLGRFGVEKSAMLQGAREGVQYGMLAYADSTNINTTAKNATGLTGVTATNSIFCECSGANGTAVACTTTCSSGATLKRYITVTTSRPFTSVINRATLSFGSFGNWSPPTTVSASVTMIVP